VLRRVDELTVTRSDNTQWTISQLEVDTLRLALAIDAAGTGEAEAMQALRQRFDIFYSRFRTLGRANVYRLLFDDAAYSEAYDEIDAFLERQVPIIDGSDEDLRAALDDMAAETSVAHSAIREMALRGLHIFAEQSDRQRAEVVALILRTGLITVLLLAILAVVVLMMLKAGRQADAAAKRSAEANRNLAMIVNTSLDAIVVTDEEGVVRTFNPAAETTFGWSRDEAIGRPMTDLMIPEHHRAAHEAGMKRFVETGEAHVIGAGRVQLDARHKNGRIFPVELSLSTDQDETGRIFVAFLRDITRRRENEDALMAARDDALAAARKKAEFLAVMSHEIRTPLNGMLGAIELMSDGPLDVQQRRWLETLRGSGELLLSHVNDVLDLSRLESGEANLTYQHTDLRALCDAVLASQASTARAVGNRLISDIAADVPSMVRIDGRRLSQVLLNLVGNANKFTRDGAVKLSIRSQSRMNDRIGLEIHVTDTGIGIGAADRDRIFEEFVMLDSSYERGNTGTGLGLAISRRLVRAMGGEIDVLDAPGGGADFRILLDVEAPPAAADTAARDAEGRKAAEGPRLHVLLVEDNAINRDILGEMLCADGHAVTMAVDGRDGLAQAGAQRFDLVLMDISMPGLDGVETTTMIRAGAGPNALTPIVAVTAHAMPEEVERFRGAGMLRTLTKPIDRAALRKALAEIATPDTPLAPKTPTAAGHEAQLLMDDPHLAELSEIMGEQRFFDLIERLIAQGDAVAEAAEGQTPSSDPAAFAGELHALAGVSAMLGAKALWEALVAAETRLQQDGKPMSTAERQELSRIWAETRAAYADLCD
jgi:PAS domain S-box-containing protein